MPKIYTTDSIIERFRIKNNHDFDYSKVVYKGMKIPVTVVCPKHGDIDLTPSQLLRNMGCPKCLHESLTELKTNKSDFTEKANKIHDNKYDYSKVDYKGILTKVCIVCPKHGEFWQTPDRHLSGCGCPKCGFERQNDATRLTTDEFIRRSRLVHGNKYDYSKVEYKSLKDKVSIICPIHEEFKQAPIKHMNGQGCPKCGRTKKLTLNEFVNKSNKVHNNRYDYSKVDYINNSTKVCIICPEHGEFWQTPHNHLIGQGCPKCADSISDGEIEIINYIKSLINLPILTNYRKILDNNKELDIYIPSKRIAFEYDGMIWHSEKFRKDKNYHLNKTTECEKKDIKLYHIYEYEWVNKKDIVKSKIRNILGIMNGNDICLKECVIKEISIDKAKIFLETNNIQGFTPSSVYIGAFYNRKLISVMTLLSENNGVWNLSRFAVDIRYNVKGIMNYLIEWFINHHNPNDIETMVDRRWNMISDCDEYTKIGFSLIECISPDYCYTKGQNDYIVKTLFNKKYLIGQFGKKYNFTEKMTEIEMIQKIGFYRIYDCGQYHYVWKKEK